MKPHIRLTKPTVRRAHERLKAEMHVSVRPSLKTLKKERDRARLAFHVCQARVRLFDYSLISPSNANRVLRRAIGPLSPNDVRKILRLAGFTFNRVTQKWSHP